MWKAGGRYTKDGGKYEIDGRQIGERRMVNRRKAEGKYMVFGSQIHGRQKANTWIRSILYWTDRCIMVVDWFPSMFLEETGGRPIYSPSGRTGCCIPFRYPGGQAAVSRHPGGRETSETAR
jgi:hypothetical protein